MRYLNKRDEFLKNYNKIVSIKEKYTPAKDEQLIKEDIVGGPFTNNVGWGDSLLGRLINSAIRKAKIGANLVRMKGVEQRLRDAMDDLLLTTSVAELDEEDKKLYARALITTYLLALEKAVENGDPLEELKSLTTTAINAVENNKDLEDKNELLRQLNEWLKFLNEFKEEEESQEGQEEGQGTEEKMNVNEAQFGNFKYLFNMLLIFKGIETERIEYNRSRTATATGTASSAVNAGTSGSSGTATTTTTTPSGTAGSNGTSTVANPAGGGATIGRQQVLKDGKLVDAAEKENQKVSLLKYDQFKRINEGVGKVIGGVVGKIWKFITGGKDERKLDEETEKLWNSLNQVYKVFVHAGETKEGGVLSKDSEFHRFLKLTPEQIEGDPKLRLEYNRYKTNLSKIYTFVRSENGITEGVHDILGKTEDMGKKIATLYSVTKTKPDGSFPQYPGTIGEVWDELVENIAGFNKYMKNVFDVESKWKVGDTVSWKSDKTGNTISQEVLRIDGKKLVFKDKKGEEYTKFMSEVEKVEESTLYKSFKRIYEAQDDAQDDVPVDAPTDAPTDEPTDAPNDDDTKDGEVSGWKNPNSVTRIQDWWGKNMDLKRWMLEKTEVEKVRINLEKKLAEKKDSIVIEGMDPVLEIVKVFNRAYKLHTTQVIPTGRSDGKVSNKTFLEYHSFGGGSPKSAGESGGPYRNIAIFNQWEDCVNDVKKDKRYQCIFNVGTTIKVGNEFIEKAGSNLRKFMTDMLDGEELYKGGTGKEQGAQAKFLDKYFGYKEDKDGKDTYYDGDSERMAINDAANGVKSIKLGKIDAKATPIPFTKPEELKGTFFSIKLKERNEDITYYFCVQDVYDQRLYLTFSQTAYYMAQMIKKERLTTPILKGEYFATKEERQNKKTFPIHACTAQADIIFKDGKWNFDKINLGYITKKAKESKSGEDSVDNHAKEIITVDSDLFNVSKVSWIVDLEEGATAADAKRIKVSEKAMNESIAITGGFLKIKENYKDVNNTKLKGN